MKLYGFKILSIFAIVPIAIVTVATVPSALAMKAEDNPTGSLVPAVVAPNSADTAVGSANGQATWRPASFEEEDEFFLDVSLGNVEKVKAFIKAHPDYVNYHRGNACPALHRAAAYYINKGQTDCLKICEFLLEEGAVFKECPDNSKTRGGFCPIGLLKKHGKNIMKLDYWKDNIRMRILCNLVATHRTMHNENEGSVQSTGRGRSMASPASQPGSGSYTITSGTVATGTVRPGAVGTGRGSTTQTGTSTNKAKPANNRAPGIPSASLPNRTGTGATQSWLSTSKALFVVLGVAAAGIGYWLLNNQDEKNEQPDADKKEDAHKSDSSSDTENKKDDLHPEAA